MGTGDIVIHINETLTDNKIHSLEREIGDAQGVLCACIHERARHLMLVDFDPGLVQPSSIVRFVRQKGFHAQMLGL